RAWRDDPADGQPPIRFEHHHPARYPPPPAVHPPFRGQYHMIRARCRCPGQAYAASPDDGYFPAGQDNHGYERAANLPVWFREPPRAASGLSVPSLAGGSRRLAGEPHVRDGPQEYGFQMINLYKTRFSSLSISSKVS